MNLGQKILEKLHAMRRTGDLPEADQDSGYVIEEEMDSMRVTAEILDFDKFSCIVKTLSVTQRQAPPASVSLKELLLRQAAEIERRMTYVLENFRLVEVDEQNYLAQVRSASPYKKSEEKFYYEVLLQHGMGATFARYRQARGAEQRELVACHLTQETFERLVDDLVATLRLS
jgi:hypothetical protein